MGHETTETSVPCPCGQGLIITSRTEYDNGWSRDDVSTRLDCGICSQTYALYTGYVSVADGPGIPLEVLAETTPHRNLWTRYSEIKAIIDREYCRPVVAALVARARANEGRGGKRKAWHEALAPFATALSLPPLGATWMLDTFIRDHVNQRNVAALAEGLGLNAGLDALLEERAALDVKLKNRPRPFMWNPPAGSRREL
jgi:hypothetical protein